MLSQCLQGDQDQVHALCCHETGGSSSLGELPLSGEAGCRCKYKARGEVDVQDAAEPSRCLRAADGQSLELQPATMRPLHIGWCQGAEFQQCFKEDLESYTPRCQIDMVSELGPNVRS